MNPTEIDPILNLIPAGYKGLVLAGLVLIPILGRAFKALSLNGGLKGVLSAIIFGTNTPKVLIASLCLLSLPACTTNQPLNDKIIDVGVGLITLGLTQQAPVPPPVEKTVSK